jgi:iron complex outermembrane receptor protein
VKTFKTAYCTQPATRRALFAVSSTATGCAVLLMAATSAARAADQAAATAAADQSGPIEEVVVTGIRKGIEDSISAKRNDTSIIEAVSAEDIGKLPDASIAESIARLPGIAAQRTNGRAQTLSIRGLGPDFTITTFNGREQASTNENRTVEFDQYPSELVSQVKVFKTPNAGMSYQGIAGTTDIETVHPLAYGKRAVAATYKREWDGQSANVVGLPDTGNRANLTYINQFYDNTFGVALGFAFNKTPYQAQTKEPWGYAGLPTPQYPAGSEIIGGDKSGYQSSFYERAALLAVLEFKPNDKLHITTDIYHSNFKELQTIRRMEYGLQWASGSLTTPGPFVGNRMVSGTYTNVPFLVVENYNNDTHAKIDSLGINADYKITDDWTANVDYSWSKTHRDNLRLESTAGTGAGADPANPPLHETVSFTTDGNGVSYFNTAQDYSNYNTTFLTDPGGWGGGPTRAGYVGHPSFGDEVKSIRLAVDRKLDTGFINKVSVGVNYAKRTKSKYEWQSMLALPGGVSHAVVPEAFRTGISDTSFFGNSHGMIGYDAIALFHSGYFITQDARTDVNANSGDRNFDYTSTWDVSEKLTTPYLRFDIDSHLGSVAMTGNIGVQAQRADQSSNINFVSGIDPTTKKVIVTQQTRGAQYTDVLPSLNLNFALAQDLQLRFAAAITVARPRMDEMAGGANLSVTSDTGVPPTYNGQPYYWSQNGGGNPQLRPWKANAFDLSLEKYFGRKGYVSAALYYKNLTDYIFNASKITDFTGVALPIDATQTYALANANRIGVSTVKSNGHGGYIEGLEVTASIPGEVLWAPLDGFGLIVSGAWNRSAVNPTGNRNEPVPGLSSKVINSTLYFEKGGFSARVSNRFRGSFVGEVPLFDSSLSKQTVKSESLVDAQVGYTFQEGAFKNLSLNLSGTNLTDAPFSLYQVGANPFDLVKYEKYGSVYAVTATYKF